MVSSTCAHLIGVLNTFNEKAQKLIDSTFCKNCVDSQITVKYASNNVTVERIGPEGEEIDAFILTYRQFFQPNEPFSFGNLAIIFRDSRIPQHLREEFTSVKQELDKFLAESAIIKEKDKPVSRKRLQEIMIYGGYAHTTQKEHFDKWNRIPVASEMVLNDFIYVAGSVMQIIARIGSINLDVIKSIR